MSVENPKSNSKPGVPADGAPAPDSKADDQSTGRVKFDDKGNAVWEWSIATGAFGREVTTERLQKLENPALSIADDAAPGQGTVRPNPLGTKKGYDPYDSGKLGRPPPAAPKKDLRRLSEFFKLKKQAANKDDK